MPYLFVQQWYPPNSADEFVKIGMEVMAKYPEDESLGKRIIPLAAYSTKKGFTALSITEVKQEKLYDALERADIVMYEFRNVEGFTYELKVWGTLEESLKVINM